MKREKRKEKRDLGIKKLLCVGFLLIFVGCNIEEEKNFNFSNQAGETLVFKAEAMELAQGELDSYPKNRGKWTEESKVTDAFPIYFEGYDTPSYYECKIMTGDTPAGYILINVDATDLLLVEAMEEGLTLTESYEQELKKANSDFKVYRYGYLRSLATEKVLDPTQKTSTQLLSQRGFSSDYEIELYSKNCSVKDTTPFYTRKDLALQQEVLFTTARRSYADEVDASLRNSYNGLKTPAWRQFKREIGEKEYSVGCGPIAWAIALAYFQEFHGKTNALPSVIPSLHWDDAFPYEGTTDRDQSVYNTLYQMTINELADDLNSMYGSWGGMVGESNMRHVVDFLAKRTYSVSYDRSAAALYGKFEKVRASLSSNKPVVMAINSDGIGVIDHYVVIEKAAKNRGHFVRYYVNFGWGKNNYKWIYARGDDTDDNFDSSNGTRRTIYDIWTLTFNN